MKINPAKKIISIAMAFLLVFGLAVTADDSDMILLTEDYFNEVDDELIGKDISNLKGWSTMVRRPEGSVNDVHYTIETEPGKEENKVISVVRSELSDNTTRINIVKDFGTEVDSGRVSVTFKLRKETDALKHMHLWFSETIDESTTTWESTFYFDRGQFTMSGHNFVGSFGEATMSNPVPAELGRWYEFEYVFNLDNKTVMTYEIVDGAKKVAATARTMPKELSGKMSDIRLGLHRALDLKGAHMYLDDFVVKRSRTMDIVGTTPGNNDENVDIYKGMNIEFSDAVNPATLNNAQIKINGSTELVGRVSVDPKNEKAINISYSRPLDFETEYEVEISGVSDYGGRLSKQYNMNFKTRGKKVAFSEPIFSKNGDIISAISAGEIKCLVNGINETEEEIDVVLVAAVFKGEELVSVSTKSIILGAETNEEIPIETEVSMTSSEGLSVSVFVWNNLEEGKPLGDYHTFDNGGIRGYASGKEGYIANTVSAIANHENGEIEIKGTAESGFEITALSLAPGFDYSDLTDQNAGEAVEFIGQTTVTNGEYSFKYMLSNENRFDSQTHRVMAGTISTEFKLFGKSDTDAVLNTVKNSTVATLKKMLQKENPSLINGNLSLGEILQFNLNKYHTLSNQEAVLSELAGKTFSSIQKVSQIIANAVEVQKVVEENETEIILKINEGGWKNLEDIIKENNDILKADVGGVYSQLTSSEKIDLLKKLAREYTFVNAQEFRSAFRNEAQRMRDSRSSTDKGTGGSSGSGFPTIIKDKPAVQSPVPQTPTPVPEKTIFSDIGSVEWAVEAIEKLSERGVIEGIGGGKFNPYGPLTREQFIKMMVLAFGLTSQNTAVETFSDVNDGAWYHDYITIAASYNIVQGMGDGSFGVGREITRSEMAALLYRATATMGLELPEKNESEIFNDNASIPEYAVDSVYALQRAGVIAGVGENIFAPSATSTRAMGAQVIYVLGALAAE